MSVYQVAGLVAMVIVAGGGVWLHHLVNRRKAERLLAGRPQLTQEEFGRSYFQESPGGAALAAELREILQDHVPFKLEGLRPDDALVQDLRMDELDSLSTVEFLVEVEARYGMKVPDSVAESLRTLHDLVKYLEPRLPTARQGGRDEGAVQQADAADEAQGGTRTAS